MSDVFKCFHIANSAIVKCSIIITLQFVLLKVIYQFFHSFVDVNAATHSAVVTDGELCDASSRDEQCGGSHLCVCDRECTVEEKQTSSEDTKYVNQQKYKDSFDESLVKQQDTTMIEKDIRAKEPSPFPVDEKVDPSQCKGNAIEWQNITADKQCDGAKVVCHGNFCVQSVQGINCYIQQ